MKKTPNAKNMKVYAVVETSVELPCGDISKYLKGEKFNGAVITGYNMGGIRNVTTKENIPLTMEALDRAIEFMRAGK
jgi:hypothetical protein